MAGKTFSTPDGTWHIHGRMPAAVDEAAELAGQRAELAEAAPEPLVFVGARAWIKGGPLAGRARWRHGLRRVFLRARAPRLQEYLNLRWLHERLFQVAPPLAAGVLLHRGWPRYQFLITREVADARPMDRVLEEEDATSRRRLFEELGRELARMHALSFVHHDLFLRNLLVLGPDRSRRIVFLDAWAGGTSLHLRGPAYDLACLFLEGADLIDPEDQHTFLRTYLDVRQAQGRPAPRGLLARVDRERRALVRRLRRDPARLGGRELPGPWPPSAAFLEGLDGVPAHAP